jgi:hypothetical protein
LGSTFYLIKLWLVLLLPIASGIQFGLIKSALKCHLQFLIECSTMDTIYVRWQWLICHICSTFFVFWGPVGLILCFPYLAQ